MIQQNFDCGIDECSNSPLGVVSQDGDFPWLISVL